jgi:hypothetical protein
MQPLDRPDESFDLICAVRVLTQLFDPGLQTPLHKAADSVRSAEVLIVGPGVDGAFELEWHSHCGQLI